MTAVNHILKAEQDNPTIGLLICKDKDNVLAQYALESLSQPIGVAEFQLTKFIPDEFKSSLPSLEDIGLKRRPHRIISSEASTVLPMLVASRSSILASKCDSSLVRPPKVSVWVVILKI